MGLRQLRALDQHFRTQNSARRDLLKAPEPKPWKVIYRFAIDRPGMEHTRREATARDLARFLRDTLNRNAVVLRIREDV